MQKNPNMTKNTESPTVLLALGCTIAVQTRDRKPQMNAIMRNGMIDRVNKAGLLELVNSFI